MSPRVFIIQSRGESDRFSKSLLLLMVCPKWGIGQNLGINCWNALGAKVSKYYFGSDDSTLIFANVPKFLMVRECCNCFAESSMLAYYAKV
jgi:hypothetical protein